jgi:hypothetical protein
MTQRTYRKTVREAGRELLGIAVRSPGEDAILHGTMTQKQIADARETIARARAVPEAARSRLAQTDPQQPDPSPAHELARGRDTEAAGAAPGEQR